ncbi:hypothetical protein F0562_025634 [Nyssa sinensis]|uniref:non-specific serine/threonine protein kinase n=1 Tax=Nyssa sinensis TaxID=561372 RepID=A0A5J5BAM6_9ASTE|nr:hypothetical protein F0562_025634 [Nyssa sinensis]
MACVLDFTSFPYQPTGECIGDRQKIIGWGSFPTTLCCQNALNVFSKALADQARKGQGNIFILEDQWKNCSGSFNRQPSVSAQSCGFDDLFNGSSKCSSLSLSSIQQDQKYQDALNKCSGFNNSFENVCGNCTAAIVAARDHQLSVLQVNRDNTEKKICGMAVVTSIAAGNLDDPVFVNDFYGCLDALNVFDPGYIKIRSSSAKTVLAILLATIGLLVVISLVKHVSKSNKRDPKPVQTKDFATWSGLYRFSKAEIENAINYGNERKCLGRGSAGMVYRGVLPSGQVVAIKKIYNNNTSDSFTREVNGLSKIRHPNLVCLFGCCMEDGEQYLVYEYCSAGNLAQHLLRKDTLLTWERRVKILRDCALGLKYLHHHVDGCIVHRDIKLTNILLTEELEAKLSDFGLSKLFGMEESKVFTDVRGTIGYMDPEYMTNAKLTCASDVYSFGIVALQLLSGQKVIELDLEARDQLTRKAKDVRMGKRPLTDIEDPRLKGDVNRVDFESILQIAVLCVARSSKGRPSINVVFEEMQKAWLNTKTRTNQDVSQSATSQSRSTEVLPV